MAYKQKIIKSFNSGADSYNRAADIQPQAAEQLAHYLLGIEAEKILEIGCGTGLFSQYLPPHFPAAKILLTDISPAMLEQCQQTMLSNQNVSFMLMDGEAIALADQFDLIVSSMTLHWFQDFKASLQKIIARLSACGHFIFTMLGENSLQEWREICATHAVSSTPVFISRHQLQAFFPALKIRVEQTKQFYQNAFEFLTTLKLIGANIPHIEHTINTPGKLRRLMRLLDKKYPQGIQMTYEIIYGSYQNK